MAEFDTLQEAQAAIFEGQWYGPKPYYDTEWNLWYPGMIIGSGVSPMDSSWFGVVEIEVQEGHSAIELLERYSQARWEEHKAKEQAELEQWRASLTSLEPLILEGSGGWYDDSEYRALFIDDKDVSQQIEQWLNDPSRFAQFAEQVKIGRVRLTIEWVGNDDDD